MSTYPYTPKFGSFVSSILHSHASVVDTIQNSSLGGIPMTITTPLTKPQDYPTTPSRVVIQSGNLMVENYIPID
jgi:hypothetical protein